MGTSLSLTRPVKLAVLTAGEATGLEPPPPPPQPNESKPIIRIKIEKAKNLLFTVKLLIPKS
jgi:hypothetical protein